MPISRRRPIKGTPVRRRIVRRKLTFSSSGPFIVHLRERHSHVCVTSFELRAFEREWLGMIAGGLAVILSFVWDYRNTMAGGPPNPFNWPLS